MINELSLNDTGIEEEQKDMEGWMNENANTFITRTNEFTERKTYTCTIEDQIQTGTKMQKEE